MSLTAYKLVRARRPPLAGQQSLKYCQNFNQKFRKTRGSYFTHYFLRKIYLQAKDKDAMHIAIKLQIIRWYLFISLCTSGVGNFCVQNTQCTQIATYLLTFPRSTDKRTDVWSRPSCLSTQIFSPKKTGFSPIKNTFQNFFDFCLPLFYYKIF